MKNLIISAAFLFITINVLSQEKTITGKVTVFKSIAISNVKVISKKTKNEVYTDNDGQFTIKCTKNDVLSFIAECFQVRKEKTIKDTINVNLYFINNPKNQELVVKYGYINKDTLEYALSNLPNPVKDYSIYLNMYDLITGEFPYIKRVGSGFTMGPNSVNSGEGMLIILDGTPTEDISVVRPLHVSSVEVLKGYETSYYGARGSNGVIIIKSYGQK